MNLRHVAAFSLSVGFGFAGMTLAASARARLHSVPGALPKTIVPVLYDIDVVPDLATMKIRGRATVTIDVLRPMRRVVLNDLQTTVSAAAVDGVAAASIVTGPQTLTMTYSKMLAPVKHLLRIAYVATVQTSPQGTSRNNSSSGTRRVRVQSIGDRSSPTVARVARRLGRPDDRCGSHADRRVYHGVGRALRR